MEKGLWSSKPWEGAGGKSLWGGALGETKMNSAAVEKPLFPARTIRRGAGRAVPGVLVSEVTAFVQSSHLWGKKRGLSRVPPKFMSTQNP